MRLSMINLRLDIHRVAAGSNRSRIRIIRFDRPTIIFLSIKFLCQVGELYLLQVRVWEMKS